MEIIEQYHKIMNVSGNCEMLELFGRTAYKSENNIVPGSAETFIQNIIKRGHESVLEHMNITVKFVTDRGVTHELVRHRLCAYTQESTRYCNYSFKGIAYIKPVFWNNPIKDMLNTSIVNPEYDCWLQTMQECEHSYNYLIANGSSPQEARSVLPNSLKTEIVCTANVREWRHILKLRTNKSAHPQMRALMIPLLKEFKEKFQVLFNDIELPTN